MTEWPSDQVTEWPCDQVTEWLSDRVTESFADDWTYGIFLFIECNAQCLGWIEKYKIILLVKNEFLKVAFYVYLVTDQFCKKWLSPKNVIFCPKNAFFDKNCNIYPCNGLCQFDVRELYFPMVFCYLNPEGYIEASWGTWWNHPLNIFNLVQNWPFLEILKKKNLPKVI